MENYHKCEYNSNHTNPRFVGYCQLPKYHIKGVGQKLVECKGCPCEDFLLMNNDD